MVSRCNFFFNFFNGGFVPEAWYVQGGLVGTSYVRSGVKSTVMRPRPCDDLKKLLVL